MGRPARFGEPSVAQATGAGASAGVNSVAQALACTAGDVAADAGRAAALSATAVSISALAADATPAAPSHPVSSPPAAAFRASRASAAPAAAAASRALPAGPASRPPSGPASAFVPPNDEPTAAARDAAAHPRFALPVAGVATTHTAAAYPMGSSVPLLAAARAAGRRAGRGSASAVASATAAGRRAGADRVGAHSGGSNDAAGIGSLDQDLRSGLARWTGRGGAPAGNRAVGFIPPVPTQVLRSADTTRATLQALCQERTIAFGPDDSDQSLKTSLLRFNACASTTAGADMQWLAVHVRRQALSSPGHLSAFQAAVCHPDNVGIDAATGPPASSRPRYAPAISLSQRPERPPSTPTRAPDGPPPKHCSPSRLLSPPLAVSDGVACHHLHHSAPPPPAEATPAHGASDDRDLSSGHRSSAVHAARMVQSMLEEEAERERRLASSEQVAQVQDTVGKVLSRLDNFAQSQAAANSRLDSAFVGVVNGQTAVMAAAAAVNSTLGTGKRPADGSRSPSAKKAKASGAPVPSLTRAPGGGSHPAVEEKAKDYQCPLVHSWAMPPEMLTTVFPSQPLLKQLTAMLRMCHVSVDHPGLFGSYACLRLYEEGLVKTAKVVDDGGTAGAVNTAKTEKMRNVVKNKADLWLRQIYWLHGVVPTALKPPERATFDQMQEMKLSDADCAALMRTIKDNADEVGWPVAHPVRTETKARVSTLRKLLSAMASRTKVESNVSVILTTAPFDKLLEVATENMRKKYM